MKKLDEHFIDLDKVIPEYHNDFFLIRKLFRARINIAIKLATLKSGESVLDLGCGPGYLLNQIHKRSPEISLYGLDINPNVKRLIIPGCRIKIGDARSLPYNDSSFDTVFALDVLEHIREVDTAIDEMRRVLKPGGRCILSGPTESLFYKLGRFFLKGTFSKMKGPENGVHYHTIYVIRERLQAVGFQLIEQKKLPRFFLPPLFFVCVAR